MARQVYFDPFGSYTEGFDRGAARQTNTEDSVRRARSQDYDFNVLAPYRLAAIQREDQLGRTTLPIQMELAPFALDTARANRYDTLLRQAKDYATLFNTTAPLEQLSNRYFGVTPAQTTVGNGDPVTQLFMNSRNGEPVPVSQVPNLSQHILDTLNWNRLLQAQKLANQQQYQAGQLDNRALYNDAFRLGQQGRLLNALGQYGAQPVTGISLFGDSMPNGAELGDELDEYNLGGQ